MKNSLIPLIIALGLLPILRSCLSNNLPEETDRPNIIFLMDDQHRWDALGVVNHEVVTPNLDKLAEEGVHFTQAVCQAPMCVASRYSMMLGLYPNQVGVLRNEPGLPDDKLPNIPLPRALKEAGYETAGFGKTHWSVDCGTRGFETRYIGECFEEGANMMIDMDPEAKKAYGTETLPYGAGEEGNLGYIGETSKVKEEKHRDGWVFNRCLDYLNTRKDDRPLFLYLSFLKPHAGHNVPEGFEEAYAGKTITPAVQPQWDSDFSPHALGVNTGRPNNEPYAEFWKNASPDLWEQMTKRYYANCTWIDDMFGRTMEALKQRGLLENAIIIYLSDHGEMLGERHYRFNKYCLYESSARVPIILSGSALSDEFKGKTDKRPVELTDVYPTILKAAGIDVPDKLPGINLLSAETRSASFCALHERSDEAAFMWRTEKYKLILRMNRKADASAYIEGDIIGGEFYKLETDPQEWENVFGAKEVESQQAKMTGELLNHLKKLERAAPHSELIDDKQVKEWSAPFRNWHYYPDHVIPVSPHIQGYEDILMTDVPTVFQIPGSNRWYMSFIGFDGHGYQSFIAESEDLVHWDQMKLAMGYGPEGEFDNGGVVLGAYLYEDYDIRAPRTLKKKDGKFVSLYGAYPRQGGYELRPGYEGLASSVDGLSWQRAKNEPILSVHQEDCGDWEKDCIYQPWLLEHDDKYHNLYNAANGQIEQLGLARSDNLSDWKRHGDNPVITVGPKTSYNEKFSSDIKVFWDKDHWAGFFFGVGKGGAHIMMAFSYDLVNWTIDSDPIYKAGGNPSGLDALYAHKISLVWNPENECYYMFYCAVDKDENRGIGLITSKAL